MAELKSLGRRFAAVGLLGALIALASMGSTASAAYIHKAGVSEKFGSDGTAATSVEATSMALDQSRQRLYAAPFIANVIQIHGFNLPAHTPIAGNFPIEHQGAGTLSVDQNNGHIYLQGVYTGIAGWDFEGNPLNPAVYPIPADNQEDQCSSTVDPHGNIWVADARREQVQVFNPVTGGVIKTLNVKAATGSPCKLAFDESNEDLYLAAEEGGLWRLTAASEYHTANTLLKPNEARVEGMAVDPVSHIVYVAGAEKHEGENSTPLAFALSPSGARIQQFTTGSSALFNYGAVVFDRQTGALYMEDANKIDVLPGQIVPTVTTLPATNATPDSFVANGHVDPAGGGTVTNCFVEWGTSLSYGEPTVPCSSTTFSAAQDVSAEITGLDAGKTYHYRVVAENAEGRDISEDATAKTADRPTLEGIYADEVTETGATLHARINPNALETTYWFEYGTSVAYGSKIPVPAGSFEPSQEAQPVEERVTGLNGGTYHYRLVAENSGGTSVSEDHTFNFFPQSCPNGIVRQETGSEYLPDCRGYELVSPGNAGNVILVPQGAQPGPLATSPPRFAYGGELGGVTGTEPLNSLNVDTYVATRTSTGWKTALVGLKGSEALGAFATLADQKFDEFMDFRAYGGFEGVTQPRDNLPFIWDPDGNFLGRWPLTQPLIPDAAETLGAFQASPDFSHLAFSSVNVPFTINGLERAPGSAYDYNSETGATSLISRLPGGEELDIPQAPGAAATNQYIIFPGMSSYLFGVEGVKWAPAAVHPGVSTDGSHILMSVSNGKWTEFESQGPDPARFLYMRVNDAVTYEIAPGHAVNYAGMTADGTKVFFTSPEELTGEDTDDSDDLYMWSQANGGEIQLISKGDSGQGNGEECEADWIANCDAMPIEGAYETDSPIAEESGDIYFYSPEVLETGSGIKGAQNLYRYHEGTVTFVAALSKTERYCPREGCSNGSIGRIQVTPNGDHVAFVTRDQLTPYNNNNYVEMYTYDPATRAISCVSCMPNGAAPTGDVAASLQGNFMTEDGRTFFYSPDPLTPKDTNKIEDVYEFAEGRPQLITPGTSAVNSQTSSFHSRRSGFEGVSMNGTDVYFSTYDTLVGQDENGQSLKFYDARSGGGFPFVPPSAPCEAADECHGEGSLPPNSAAIASNVDLGEGSNVPSSNGGATKQKRHKKHRKHRKKAHARRHHRHTGGSR